MAGVVMVRAVDPFAVTGFDVKTPVAPCGKPETVNVTGDVNPFVPVTKIV